MPVVRLIIRSVVTIFVFAVTLSVYGQTAKMFTVGQGLSSSLINAVCQDHYGFIWIATEDGLNRYDGLKLTVYRNDPNDSHSLAYNFVNALCTTREGQLLVGTHDGVQLYDPNTDSFSLSAQYEDGGTHDSYISAIIQRRNGEIWVSGNALCRLQITEEGLFYERLQLPIPISSTGAMVEDDDGNLWITTGKGDGIYRINSDGKTTVISDGVDMPLINTLCCGAHGEIYGGSPQKGVYRYDKQQGKFVPLFADERQALPVSDIVAANDNEIYIATDGYGVKVYNTATRQLSDYPFDDNIISSWNGKVHAICRDNIGNYWIAIYQKGVLMLPQQRNDFVYWGAQSPTRNIIGSCCVMSVYRDADGTTYVGTDNDGIYIVDREGRQSTHYLHTSDPHSVPATIMSIFEDSHHNIYLGSYGNGVALFEPRTGRCSYLTDIVASNGAAACNVYAFAEDSQHRIWIATMGEGLFSYDLTTQKTSHYPDLDPWISCLHYSKEKNSLFLGTYYGICSVNLSDPTLVAHYVQRKTIINTLYEDNRGHIWAGTTIGLLDWDTATDSIQTFTIEEGLCNNFVCAIQGSADGHLWISTGNGLARYDSDTQKFTNYFVDDGLQGNEFSKNASLRDSEGLLWFGGTSGITHFDPTAITDNNRKWHVRVTDFYLFGQPVRCGMTSGGTAIITAPVYEATTFHLAHNDNVFTVEFSTVEFDNTNRITYEYSLDGDTWISLPQGTHSVSFTNLSPGTYHLCLKAHDGTMDSDIKEITIRIAAPWWNTAMAWVLYIIAFLVLIALVAVYLRQRYAARQKHLRLLHAEQLNEEKLQFYINISHEIRTPITLIMAPLQKLLQMDKEATCQQLYNTIYRNAERILNLINQLLDTRRIDKGQMKLAFREIDMVEMLQNIYNSFCDVAGVKSITFTFSHGDINALPVWVDPAHFDKIILNILSNAFKFTPDGGTIDLALDEEHSDDASLPPEQQHSVVIAVTDSGIGIDAAEVEHIFERFYQTRNGHSYRGTGIGLHLVRSLVEMHHGTVVATNRDDGQQGSRFIVRIPLGSGHLRADEKEGSSAPLPVPQIETTIAPLVTPQDDDTTATHHTYHLLLVEDDEEMRRYLRHELADRYHVEESSNGKEALEIIQHRTPDLVISDVMMPVMDGITLCRKIKQNIRLNSIPVVLLTARIRDEERIQGLDVGADAYVVKPFNITVLRHTLRNLLQGRDQLRTIYSGMQQRGEEMVEPLDIKSPDERLMERVMKVVNAHIGDPSFSIATFAVEVGLSRSQLHRKLKELTNQSARDFIRNVRIQQAATLLSQKRQSISEVAEKVGFTSLSAFSICFKEQYGVAPSAYYAQQQAKAASDE